MLTTSELGDTLAACTSGAAVGGDEEKLGGQAESKLSVPDSEATITSSNVRCITESNRSDSLHRVALRP